VLKMTLFNSIGRIHVWMTTFDINQRFLKPATEPSIHSNNLCIWNNNFLINGKKYRINPKVLYFMSITKYITFRKAGHIHYISVLRSLFLYFAHNLSKYLCFLSMVKCTLQDKIHIFFTHYIYWFCCAQTLLLHLAFKSMLAPSKSVC